MLSHKNSFAVLGLSKFGYRIAISLYKMGADVIAVDKDEKTVQKISEDVTKAVTANASDWEALEHAGVFNVDTIVIGLRHSFDESVLLTLKIKKEKDIKKLIVQVDSDEKAEALKILGADMIVFPEKDIAERVVTQLTTPNLLDHIPLSSDVAIMELPVPESFVGKSILDLKIRSEFHIYVIGVRHNDVLTKKSDMKILPSPNRAFSAGDTLILLGKSEKLNDFIVKHNQG